MDHAAGEDALDEASFPDPLDLSSLFDPEYYARSSGLRGTRAELLAHYLLVGEAGGVPPSAAFEPALYALLYPDVVAAGTGLLRHYVVHGRAERRYATHAALTLDTADLKASGLFDEIAFAHHLRRPPLARLSMAEEYVATRAVSIHSGSYPAAVK